MLQSILGNQTINAKISSGMILSSLIAVARKPCTLALRHLCCDMIGEETGVAAFFRKLIMNMLGTLCKRGKKADLRCAAVLI